MHTIESRLKELRATADESRQVIANMADSTQSSINRFENDQSDVDYYVRILIDIGIFYLPDKRKGDFLQFV